MITLIYDFSGCEECNSANTSDCLKHGPLHPIPNRPVLSKARASLPLVLYIDRFLGGVFSKRRIPKRTQFGPVEGPLVPQSELQDHYIHLKVRKQLRFSSGNYFFVMRIACLFIIRLVVRSHPGCMVICSWASNVALSCSQTLLAPLST